MKSWEIYLLAKLLRPFQNFSYCSCLFTILLLLLDFVVQNEGNKVLTIYLLSLHWSPLGILKVVIDDMMSAYVFCLALRLLSGGSVRKVKMFCKWKLADFCVWSSSRVCKSVDEVFQNFFFRINFYLMVFFSFFTFFFILIFKTNTIFFLTSNSVFSLVSPISCGWRREKGRKKRWNFHFFIKFFSSVLVTYDWLFPYNF